MTEVAGLIIKVDSQGAKIATGDLDRLTAAGGRSERAADGLARSWKVAGAAIGTAAVGATAAFVQMAEAHQNATSRLRLATSGAEEFNAAYSATYDIAQRTGTALDGVAGLYARLAQSSTELGLSQGQIAQVTETVTQAFIVSGATAQETAGGIRQLTQAMAGGTLRAEEFNSIIESSPRIVQALADHFGVSFGKVRQLVNDGKVSSQEFAQALLAASQAVQGEFSLMPVTIGRAMQEVRTALQAMVGGANASSGATDKLATAIRGLARELESEAVRDGFATVVGGVSELITYGTQAIDILTRAGNVMDGLQGRQRAAGEMFNAALRLNTEDYQKAWADYQSASALIDKGFAPGPEKPPHPGIDFTRPAPSDGSASAGVRESIDAATDARKKQTAADRAWAEQMADLDALDAVQSAARMERVNELLRMEREKEDAQQRASETVRQLIDDMQFENSLIGKSAVEQERMIALRYAGAAATAEQRRAISELVDGMERARSAAGDVQFLEDGARNLFGELVAGAGRATDAMDRFFDNLKRRAADKAFDALLKGFGGMAGGGGWAGFVAGFAGVLGGGRAAGGPVMAGQGYLVGEEGPEVVTFGQSGRVHPLGAPAGGSANVKLEVINNGPPMHAEHQRATAPDGTQIIRLVLNAVADDFASGGRTAQAARARFGLRDAV
jgi:tape measure domain-containing protein